MSELDRETTVVEGRQDGLDIGRQAGPPVPRSSSTRRAHGWRSITARAAIDCWRRLVFQSLPEVGRRSGRDELDEPIEEVGSNAMGPLPSCPQDDLSMGSSSSSSAQIERPTSGSDWKTNLRQQSMAARAVMLRHPWARRVLEERGTGGRPCLAYIESILATLHDGGFSIELAHHALHVLSSRIFGFTQDLFEEPGLAIPTGRGDHAPGAGRLPRVVELAMAASHEGVLGPCDDDVEFAFGLDLYADGLERARDGA